MPKLTESLDMFNIDGPVVTAEPLWRHTTFALGGPAAYYAQPLHLRDAQDLLATVRSETLPCFILGGGSNLLVADNGIPGLVLDTRHFQSFSLENRVLELGAGLAVSEAAWMSGSQGAAGLDFLYGMPGSVGGAAWMNARCYDGEIADRFLWAEVLTPEGAVERINYKEGDWAYKVSPFQGRDWLLLKVAFSVVDSNPQMLKRTMVEHRDDREAKGHYRAPCAGSAFKNNRAFGEPSGKLIDRCGLKGLRRGGAKVSEWHGNIVVNDRGASSREVRDLLEEVQATVHENLGFAMEAEVQMVGDWAAKGDRS